MKYDLAKISQLLDRDKIELFQKIVGNNSFKKLISAIGELKESDQDVIFSAQKRFDQFSVLRSEKLNKLGLHIFRIMAAESSIHKRRALAGFEKNYITDIMDAHGCLKIENFLDADSFSKIESIVMAKDTINALPGHYNQRTGWNSHYKINTKNTSGPLSAEDILFIENSFYRNKKLASIVGNFCGVSQFSYNHMHLEKMKFVKSDLLL